MAHTPEPCGLPDKPRRMTGQGEGLQVRPQESGNQARVNSGFNPESARLRPQYGKAQALQYGKAQALQYGKAQD